MSCRYSTVSKTSASFGRMSPIRTSMSLSNDSWRRAIRMISVTIAASFWCLPWDPTHPVPIPTTSVRCIISFVSLRKPPRVFSIAFPVGEKGLFRSKGTLVSTSSRLFEQPLHDHIVPVPPTDFVRCCSMRLFFAVTLCFWINDYSENDAGYRDKHDKHCRDNARLCHCQWFGFFSDLCSRTALFSSFMPECEQPMLAERHLPASIAQSSGLYMFHRLHGDILPNTIAYDNRCPDHSMPMCERRHVPFQWNLSMQQCFCRKVLSVEYVN